MNNETEEKNELDEIEVLTGLGGESVLTEDDTDDDDIVGLAVIDTNVEFGLQTIQRIHEMFDAGCTKNTIARTLKLERADVITVLDSYVGRKKINGNSPQRADFVFNGEGRYRIELGDRLNTSIYVKVGSTGQEIAAIKKKWFKIINNKDE